MTLGKQLRSWRTKCGLSLRKLAIHLISGLVTWTCPDCGKGEA